MTKDQGLYNKPSAAAHPGALAAWTLPQYNSMGSMTTNDARSKDEIKSWISMAKAAFNRKRALFTGNWM